MTPLQRNCPLLSNHSLANGYFRAQLDTGDIARHAAPGQFIHLRLPELEGHLLRRPFSICDATADGRLTLVYKAVGVGTRHLAACRAGTMLDLIGPLGHGFRAPTAGRPYVLVAGGYGCAAVYFAARQAIAEGHAPPQVLLGARSADDLLLETDFANLGCQLQISTNDGSRGRRGLVTDLLAETLERQPEALVAACGPMPMLRAVALLAREYPAAGCEVSLDEMMCCGVGACFGCVVKAVAPDEPSGWRYRRSCKEGPVFDAREIYWE